MHFDEALSEPEPRVRRRKKGIRSKLKKYLLLISVLLISVLLLCMNNMAIYRSYNEMRKQYHTAFEQTQTILADHDELQSYKESLTSENSALKEKNKELSALSEGIQKRLAELEKNNMELSKRNHELMEDNIALQNSLKMAAAVGIKPQNYTHFNGITSRGSLDRGKYIGKFLGTAYTPSKDECGNNKGITNSGKPIIPGISIAVDSKYWPFGTVFYIKGLGYAVAMDTGSSIKGKNRFDLAVFDKSFAKTLGQRYWEVYLVKMGNGKIKDLNF